VLDFAVAQILRDDTALGARPVVLARMVATFGLRAALAFQPSAVKGPATALIGRGRQPYPDTPGRDTLPT
jgi:hypothetical protein